MHTEVNKKPCSVCKQVLPLEDFYPHRRMKLGRQPSCKKCAREWHHKRPDYVRKKNAEWKSKNPDYALNRYRLVKYGVTPEDISILRSKQDGKCAGCGLELSLVKECVDHCHSSGKVRGLLCNSCNLILGYADDRVEILNSLICYIEKAENY